MAQAMLAKGYVTKRSEVERLTGELKGSVKVPGKDATPEQIKTFDQAVGVPEKPEEYEFPEGDGVKNSEQMVKFAQGTFHKARLSKDQAEGCRARMESIRTGNGERTTGANGKKQGGCRGSDEDRAWYCLSRTS